MTFVEMIKALRSRLDDSIEPYKYPTSLLKDWLNGEYMTIMQSSELWEFLTQRGLFITTVVDQVDYTAATIKWINSQSVYYIKAGTTARVPVTLIEYNEWSEDQRYGESPTGPPHYLIQGPDQQWLVDPIPDAVYTLYADRLLLPVEMSLSADVPLWEESYHKIVLYGALLIAATLRPEDPKSVAMVTEANKFLPFLRRSFNSRYLPGFRGAEPLL